LDAHWNHEQPTDKTFAVICKLDQALRNPSKKLNAILVGGTNGKGLTIHFSTKLFQEEKITVGAFYSPHILSYNERFVINNEAISNKVFTELANEVINTAEAHNNINTAIREIKNRHHS
jgi:folylpolyglutamate synthase/dihydropteroate synthase